MPYCFSPQGYKGVRISAFRSIDPRRFFTWGSGGHTHPGDAHKLPILGFRIGDFVPDRWKTIPDGELEKLRGLDVLVISALRKTEHFSHLTLDQALTVIGMLQPRTAYLTHISHELGLHAEVEQELPEAVFLAYDGLEVVGR